MKNINILLAATLSLLAACSQKTHQAASETGIGGTDSLSGPLAKAPLIAKIKIPENIKRSDSVGLTFTVYNQGSKPEKFCVWHTPFERPMSKYLDIKNAAGEEVAYQGAMAKRMMPPPASSYLSVNGKDSLSVSVNLLKSYLITKPGKYTVKYNSESISGLSVPDSVSFTVSQ